MKQKIKKTKNKKKKPEKIAWKKVNCIIKKAKIGYKKWLVIDTEDYLTKKNTKENRQEIGTRMSQKDKQKLQYKKKWISSMSQEELQQGKNTWKNS